MAHTRRSRFPSDGREWMGSEALVISSLLARRFDSLGGPFLFRAALVV